MGPGYCTVGVSMATATTRWLDKLAAADKGNGGTGTDYKLAQIIGVDPQLMHKYRHRDTQMGDGPAMKCAEALGLHPMIVMAEIRAEQSRDARAQRAWGQVAKAARDGKIAAVILAATLGLTPRPGSASWGAESPSPVGSGSGSPSVYYVKQPRRHRRRRPQLIPGRVKVLGLWNSSAFHHA